jgi:hypothetical protein
MQAAATAEGLFLSSQQRTLLADIDIVGSTDATKSEALRSRIELVRLQFEYAWRYFQHYAGQRVSIFNFFMIFAGASGTVYFTLLSSTHWVMAILQPFLASILSLFFLCLDRRMEELIHIAEDVLRLLEEDVIFQRFCGIPGQPARRWPLATSAERAKPRRQKLGIHVREDDDIREFRQGIALASGKSGLCHPAETPAMPGGWLQRARARVESLLDRGLIIFRKISLIGNDGRSPYRVGYWFPAIQTILALLFLALSMYGFWTHLCDICGVRCASIQI